MNKAKKEKAVKKNEKKPDVIDNFVYHITQVKDETSEFNKMWRVRRSGSTKVIKHFKTQNEAIEHAKRFARDNETNIVIHKTDGKIRKQKY